LSKKLNFFPYYKHLLKLGLKNTTLRLGKNDKFDKNDLVTITVGWSEWNSQPLYIARILNVIYKRIKDLSEEDLEGESPDCAHKNSVEYVLSAIYRKIVTREDYVTVIKWEDIKREG
jgi:hypothetical protein